MSQRAKIFLFFFFFLLLAGTGAGFWFYNQSKKLKIEAGKTETQKALDITNFQVSDITNLKINQQLIIKNFSQTGFKLQQIYVEVWSADDKEKLAEQDAPLPAKTDLPARVNTPVNIPFQVSTSKVLQELQRQGIGGQEILNKMLYGTKAGLKLKLKGFVLANSLRTDLNEEITV